MTFPKWFLGLPSFTKFACGANNAQPCLRNQKRVWLTLPEVRKRKQKTQTHLVNTNFSNASLVSEMCGPFSRQAKTSHTPVKGSTKESICRFGADMMIKSKHMLACIKITLFSKLRSGHTKNTILLFCSVLAIQNLPWFWGGCSTIPSGPQHNNAF